MKILNMMAVSVIAVVIHFSAFSDENDKSEASSKSPEYIMQNMPMMGAYRGQMPMMGGYQGQMPMMGGYQGHMPMMGNYQGQMPMYQHMQQRQAFMQAHMIKMEKHLADISASLKKIAESQKSR